MFKPKKFFFRYNGRHSCGASIISSKYGVTAAHCVRKRGSYTIRAGSAELYRGGIEVFVNQAFVHPDNDAQTDDFDIAILQFAQCLK